MFEGVKTRKYYIIKLFFYYCTLLPHEAQYKCYNVDIYLRGRLGVSGRFPMSRLKVLNAS